MSSVEEAGSPWSATLERAYRGLVIIRSKQARAYNEWFATALGATGFVIAIEGQKIRVLTARHAVQGLTEGTCVFHDHEEVKMLQRVGNLD
jgi:hypothetical protein